MAHHATYPMRKRLNLMKEINQQQGQRKRVQSLTVKNDAPAEFTARLAGWYLFYNGNEYQVRRQSSRNNGTADFISLDPKGNALIYFEQNESMFFAQSGAATAYIQYEYHGNHKPDVKTTAIAGDIEVGAVEIKNAASDVRALVEAVAGKNCLAVTPIGGTAPVNSFAAATTSAGPGVTNVDSTILVANAARKYAVFVNQSVNDVWLGLGVVAVANTGIFLKANGGNYEITPANLCVGAIHAIAGAAGPFVVTVSEA